MTNNKKIEYGDFQTPRELAREVCRLLKKNTTEPKSIIEPTCGIGAFFIEALSTFPNIKSGCAFDLNNEYIDVLKNELSKKRLLQNNKIEVADFFSKDWQSEISSLTEPILVIGNPPWVTNSQLGQLQSDNLPTKYNQKKMKGLDALTGKSNFDISEWMISQMIDWIQEKRGVIAMLCKTSVARKVLLSAWQKNKKMEIATMHIFDSKTYFNISADSCLLTVVSSKNRHKECKIYDHLWADNPNQTIGLRDNFLVADIPSYEETKHLIDGEQHYQWRTGVKHDCSKIMELEQVSENQYINGLGEINELENKYLFPLLKGSNLANGKIPSKFMIVPQTRIGQDTSHLEITAPKTWQYLTKHSDLLDRRASSIYKDKPKFSIFGVGDYTFSKWKVAIPALYKKLDFSVIGPYQNKVVVFDDTVNFIALDNEKEACELADILNSKKATTFYHSFIFWDSKRPITVQLLKSLDIDELLTESGNTNRYSISKHSKQLQLI
ncbi:N-6 DNA methylase [Patescibacteria group bacterium]|nr:N-6 DNA methylase [Patescibacteria group bacterium]